MIRIIHFDALKYGVITPKTYILNKIGNDFELVYVRVNLLTKLGSSNYFLQPLATAKLVANERHCLSLSLLVNIT